MACALSQCMSSSPLHILARFRELCICDWNRYVSLQPRTPGPHSCWEIKSSSCANWITLDPTDQNKDAKTCILHHLEDSKRVSDQPCLRSHKMLPSLFGISSSMSVSANHCFSRLLCNSRPLDIPSAYTSVLMTLPYVILSAHGLLYANIFHQYSVAIAWCIPATSGPKIYIYTQYTYIMISARHIY